MKELEASTSAKERKQLITSIANILDEAKSSSATHNRKIKELSGLLLRCRTGDHFHTSFSRCIAPIFLAQRRTVCTERVIRFVSAFACACQQSFLHEFLRYLLVASVACNKTVRFRACQIISEIVMRLPDDAEVSDELWDEVIEAMKLRMSDRVPLIRTFAVRALSRFLTDSENSDILDLFLNVLPDEENGEVRKTIVLALPPSNATLIYIIDCTLDVSESVRKAAYLVLAQKFPLPSLSIKHRTTILQRGLADRSEAVTKECLKLMRDEWLRKCCKDDPVRLLKYLDVETYESVGESVMNTLLKDGIITLRDVQNIRNQIFPTTSINGAEMPCFSVHLLEPEFAFYWRTVCQYLQKEARVKGSDAAATSGTEAAVYAAEATDHNDLLESILPATTFDFIALVQHHIDAGPNYYFTSRQLLLLGSILDFSDFTSHKDASNFSRNLLLKPVNHEVDENGNNAVIGDGINLGGDKNWADAVSILLRKVHASLGQFEEVVLELVEELARPCRERVADFIHWMHCLSVTGLFLEHANLAHWLNRKSLEPNELLHSLLLPGAKNSHLDVQRVAARCLGLFALKEKRPSNEVVKQLKDHFLNGPAPVSIMACKALFDLCLWHGIQAVDKACGHVSANLDASVESDAGTISEENSDSKSNLLYLFYANFDRKDKAQSLECNRSETVQEILAEGFSKVLLLGESNQDMPESLYPLILSKLITIYFDSQIKDMERTKQCLSVFFEHYPHVAASHKKWLSKAFLFVMHAMWPGIFGNSGGSSVTVSSRRKRAVQASRFMLQMMQSPLYARTSMTENGKNNVNSGSNRSTLSFECGEEGLALRIAAEVAGFPSKKTPAEKAYVLTLCRILGSLHIQSAEQKPIKLLNLLLKRVIESVSNELIVRDLEQLADRLISLDEHPEDEISRNEANLILEKLELHLDLDTIQSSAIPQTPRCPASTQASRRRRRTRRQDDEDSSDEYAASLTVEVTGPRSQRASKAAAMSKMTANKNASIDEIDEDGVDDESEIDESSQVSELSDA